MTIYIYIYIYIYTGLDNIMETPGNFKWIYFNMVIWLQPSREAGVVLLPSYSFWATWVLKIVIKLCYNFRSRIFVILPYKPCKSPTFPIRQLSLSSRVFFSGEGFFPSFSMLSLLPRQFSLLHQIIHLILLHYRYHMSPNNLTSFKVW